MAVTIGAVARDAGGSFRSVWRRVREEDVRWAPFIEMFKKADHFVIRAELPGMKREDVDISITGGSLTIKGERKLSEEGSALPPASFATGASLA